MEYLRRYRDLKYQETVFELLAKEFEVAKLDEAREGSIIQVVDAAVPPDKKSSPHRALIVLGCYYSFFLHCRVLGLLAGELARVSSCRRTGSAWKRSGDVGGRKKIRGSVIIPAALNPVSEEEFRRPRTLRRDDASSSP